jgi:hypothetical protein
MRSTFSAKLLIAIVMAAAVCSACAIAASVQEKIDAANGQDIGEQFKKEWLKDPGPIPTGSRCQNVGGGNGIGQVVIAIRELIDPESLSSNCNVRLIIDNDNKAETPSYKVIEQQASTKDLFYCEQAIWESAPHIMSLSNAHGECVLNAQSLRTEQKQKIGYFPDKSVHAEELFFKQYSALRDQAVVIHVIPRSIAWGDRIPGRFTKAELDGLCNLKAIPLKNVQGQELIDFRTAWIDFINKNRSTKISRDEILDYASSLLYKHKELFVGS